MDVYKLKTLLSSKFRIHPNRWNSGMYTRLAPMIPEGRDIICAAEGMDRDRGKLASVLVTDTCVYFTTYDSTPENPDIIVMEKSDIRDVTVTGDILVRVTLKTAEGSIEIDDMSGSCAHQLMSVIAGRAVVQS